MTLDQALTISSTRTVDLWRLCVGEHAGWSPDSLREQALDILTTEVERLQGEAEATRDDHWARIGQYERWAEAAEATLDAAFRAGHEQGRRHDLWVNADEALAAWRARQKGTP